MLRKILFITLVSALGLAACGGVAATPVEPSPLPPVTATPPDEPISTEPGNVEPLPLPTVESPFAPQPGDPALLRGPVFLDSTELLILESFPIQIDVHLQGSLPSPCHQLRVQVSPPDSQNQIQLDVYSLADPNAICAAVLQPFDENIGLGSFPTGTYTVWVNGEKVGDFTS